MKISANRYRYRVPHGTQTGLKENFRSDGPGDRGLVKSVVSFRSNFFFVFLIFATSKVGLHLFPFRHLPSIYNYIFHFAPTCHFCRANIAPVNDARTAPPVENDQTDRRGRTRSKCLAINDLMAALLCQRAVGRMRTRTTDLRGN